MKLEIYHSMNEWLESQEVSDYIEAINIISDYVSSHWIDIKIEN